jgi:hypothetical protein
MKNRLIVSAGLVALLAGVALLVLWLLPARPAVTKANFHRIEIGMPLAEVEGILGADRWGRVSLKSRALLYGNKVATWGGDDGFAWIALDERDCVVSKLWDDAPLPFLGRLRRQLPWLPI